MNRYLRVYGTFIKSSLVRELEFRANFIAKVIKNCLWVGFFLIIILVVYSRTDSVAGWSRSEAIVLAAAVFLSTSIFETVAYGLLEIPNHVRMGTMDFIVTKPIDPQFYASVRKFSFDHIGRIFAGLLMLGYGVFTAKLSVTPVQWLAYSYLLVCSIMLVYCLMFALMTLGIWFIRIDNIWVLGESVLEISRYPIDIFPVILRKVLTYYVPLAFIATIPTQVLMGKAQPWTYIGAAIWVIIAFVSTRAFWKYSMRHYSSASS